MAKYLRDWFNRRAEDAYTHVDESKRLFNWDSGRSSYSSFFMGGKNPAKDAGKMIGSIFKVMGVPKHVKNNPKAEHVAASVKGGQPMVHIPVSMLRDEHGEYVDDPKTLDAFYGACIQNAALVSMQTDSDYVKTVGPLMGADKKNVSSLLTSVLNTERIDKKLSERFPGYLKFVQKYKDFTYDEKYEAVPEFAPANARLLDLVTRMLRYPKNITEEEFEEFAEPIKKVESMLKRRGGIPDSFNECKSFADSIAKIIYEYVEEEPPSDGGSGEGDGESEDDKKDDSGSGAEEGDGDGTPTPSPKMSKGDLDDLAGKMMKTMMPATSETPEDGSDESDLMWEDFNDFEDASEDTMSEFDWKSDGESDKSGKITFDIAEGNKAQYMRDRDKIDLTKAQVLARLFARKSKDYQFSMKSMRSGRLDTGKLAEARQHVPTIYERMGEVKTDKITLGVLIDESGSMGGECIEKARQAAIFLNEVFKKMPQVDLFIYGHSADEHASGTTELTVYREPGKVTDQYALGSVRDRYENRDGTAILATASRIRSKTKNQGILFVLSDGAPSAQRYNGAAAIEDTRKKVLQAEAMGFQVIQIAIRSHVPSEKMFNHYIKMTDIQNLPKDMVNYMSKKVDKLIKERITV
jgi:hypothetical protein